MSTDIEIQAKIQLPDITPKVVTPPVTETAPPEVTTVAAGNENGAVYFNLDWQNRQAEDRRQSLNTSLFRTGSAVAESSTVGGNTVYGETSTSAGFQYGSVDSATTLPENTVETTWENLFKLAKDHKDFEDFREQPKDFWKEVRQISEPRTIKTETNDGKVETSVVSHYETLVAAMETSGLSPADFAATLPPNEQTVFLACHQLNETFGANGANVLLQPSEEDGQISLPNDQLPAETPSGRTNTGEYSAAEESTFGAGETDSFAAVVHTSDSIRIEDKASEAPSENALPNAAVGAGSLPVENQASRTGGSLASESASVSAVAKRESGVMMGGALISGALNSVEDYQQLENKEIGGSRAIGGVYDENGGGFAAGATGAMMSAAIGRVIPGSGTDVSGVLGFVSGVVVGVEADQGLRWLGADRTV